MLKFTAAEVIEKLFQGLKGKLDTLEYYEPKEVADAHKVLDDIYDNHQLLKKIIALYERHVLLINGLVLCKTCWVLKRAEEMEADLDGVRIEPAVCTACFEELPK